MNAGADFQEARADCIYAATALASQEVLVQCVPVNCQSFTRFSTAQYHFAGSTCHTFRKTLVSSPASRTKNPTKEFLVPAATKQAVDQVGQKRHKFVWVLPNRGNGEAHIIGALCQLPSPTTNLHLPISASARKGPHTASRGGKGAAASSLLLA